MAKRLFFAAMTCCMVICSVALVACSDDDDSGNKTLVLTDTFLVFFHQDMQINRYLFGILLEREIDPNDELKRPESFNHT